MAPRVKKCLLFVSILVALAGLSSWAEVKLRIYLKDGTLRSGALVKNNEKAFVILAQSGRMEIPKKDIMFVNGKTLKQWEDRPDKLFQTEIIPDKLPEPGWVNQKANLPPPVPLQPQVIPPIESVMPKKEEPQPKEVKKPPVQPKPAAPPAAAPKKAVPPVVKEPPKKQPEPVVDKKGSFPLGGPMALPPEKEEPKPEAVQKPPVVKEVKPVPVVKKKKKKAVVKKAKPKPAAPRVVKKPKPKKWPVVAAAPAQAVSRVRVRKPRRYTRKGYADYHFSRGKIFLTRGQKGKAIQELQFTTTLDRRNAEAAYMLGKLYLEAGVDDRARKAFKHPGLKKREDVKKMLDEMTVQAEADKKAKMMFYAYVSAGAFVAFPVAFLVRRYQQKALPRKIVDTKTLPVPAVEEISTPAQEVVEEELAQIREREEAIKAAVPPPPVEEVPAPVPPIREPEPAKPEQDPEVPVFLEQPVPEPPVAKEPEPVPVFPTNEPTRPPREVPPPIPTPEHVIQNFVEKPEEKPVEPTPPPPPPTPAPEPVSKVEEYQSLFKVTKQVEEYVQRGHDLAAEERFAQAAREYRTAIALNPACIEAYLGMGYAYFIQGIWPEAMAYYVKALELDPNSADAHYGLGRVLLETEVEDQAVVELEKTLQIDPEFEDARETLSLLGRLA